MMIAQRARVSLDVPPEFRALLCKVRNRQGPAMEARSTSVCRRINDILLLGGMSLLDIGNKCLWKTPPPIPELEQTRL